MVLALNQKTKPSSRQKILKEISKNCDGFVILKEFFSSSSRIPLLSVSTTNKNPISGRHQK